MEIEIILPFILLNIRAPTPPHKSRPANIILLSSFRDPVNLIDETTKANPPNSVRPSDANDSSIALPTGFFEERNGGALAFGSCAGDTDITRGRCTMIVYVDVDDTLVRTVGDSRTPIITVIEHVRRLKADGAELYLWSAGGAEYCRQTAAELGISDCFKAFLPKPRIMIDDQEVRDWVFCTTFHPSTCEGRTLADYFLP